MRAPSMLPFSMACECAKVGVVGVVNARARAATLACCCAERTAPTFLTLAFSAFSSFSAFFDMRLSCFAVNFRLNNWFSIAPGGRGGRKDGGREGTAAVSHGLGRRASALFFNIPYNKMGTAGVRWAWAAQLACPDQQDSHRAFEKEQTPRAARQRGPRLSVFLILFNSFIRRFSQPHQGKLSLRARAGPPSPAQRQRAGEEAAASSSPTHPPNCQTRL
ncbi:hypothetical protein T492DRAFT_527272 [Pavlovales sp. CCMP2436]|nr:hypothetical protein T492DRAFT_527272 [Pavlovales sp. CCMP2436]